MYKKKNPIHNVKYSQKINQNMQQNSPTIKAVYMTHHKSPNMHAPCVQRSGCCMGGAEVRARGHWSLVIQLPFIVLIWGQAVD